ncbi:MAG TPA: CAP domain-containing protein [Patescibacteria group bacterium]|nr:CAP domain-containing protein [Patescibacteria group bacterium]
MKKLQHFIHHLLFPRESNNHRPKVLHHDSLFFVVALFVFLGSVFSTVHNTYPQVLGISANITAQDLLTFTNQKRQENGLVPLTLNDQLANAADQKATHMFANNYWAHIAPDGTTPWYFIKNAGYEYLYAGENLARGFTTAQAVVDAWMASPTHRENMLSANYQEVGFAIQTGTLTGTETILVVEELGSRYAGQSDVAPAAVTEVLPTSTPVPTIQIPTPTQQVLPSVSATPPQPTPPPAITTPPSFVAAVVSEPLFNKPSMTRTIAIGLLVFLIVVLIIDAIIIERKKIARIVAHNLDHILFLIILIILVIIFGKGHIL